MSFCIAVLLVLISFVMSLFLTLIAVLLLNDELCYLTGKNFPSFLVLGFRICPPTPQDRLKKMLGQAFNARYMSIDKPDDLFLMTPEFTNLGGSSTDFDNSENWEALSDEDSRSTRVRHRENKSFRVSPAFRRVISQKNVESPVRTYSPPTALSSAEESPPEKFLRRVARQSPVSLPWKCESQLEWMDLGPDHFPRYLRSVRCTSDRCWYGFYYCRPRAFTVKVLKRLADKCTEMWKRDEGAEDIPFHVLDADGPVFRQPWAFEEVGVNFCCDCSP